MSRADRFERELGQLLARLRESRGLSQEALATQLERDQPFVSKLERGQQRVTVADLLGWLTALGLCVEDVAPELDRIWAGSTSTTSTDLR